MTATSPLSTARLQPLTVNPECVRVSNEQREGTISANADLPQQVVHHYKSGPWNRTSNNTSVGDA